MTNKFILWCEDVNNTQDYNSFSTDTQRQTGFQGGQPASAIRVNTALRQANLVSAAIMNALMPDNQTLTYRNDLTTVTNAIVESLTQKIKTTTVDNAINSANANLINGLSITQDENGVLKLGDMIILQKKLLWSGKETANTNTPTITIQLEEDLNKGDIIEIEYEFGTFARARLTAVSQDTVEHVRLVKTVCNQQGLTLYGCDATVNKVNKTISFTTATGASISTSGTVEVITGWSMTVTKISKIID